MMGHQQPPPAADPQEYWDRHREALRRRRIATPGTITARKRDVREALHAALRAECAPDLPIGGGE